MSVNTLHVVHDIEFGSFAGNIEGQRFDTALCPPTLALPRLSLWVDHRERYRRAALPFLFGIMTETSRNYFNPVPQGEVVESLKDLFA